ncbi:MAG: hypothetical protein J6D21_12010 [Clostridia bacterium]|nr:hypothetical protein [Clostridia bacterium]
MIDWKKKLTSRKFWAAVVGFVTSVLVALNVSDLAVEQVVSVIGGVSVLIAYIIAEGFTDAADAGKNDTSEQK